MPSLQQLSEQADEYAGTRFGDVQIVSSLLNQYQWSDGNLHDVVEIGWQAAQVPGLHYVRIEALDGWQDRAIAVIDYQRCVILQIYAGATDNGGCQGFVPPSGVGIPGTPV